MAFADPNSLTVADPDHLLEAHRYVLLGRSYRGWFLVAVHSDMGDAPRIISARKATKTEMIPLRIQGRFDFRDTWHVVLTGSGTNSVSRFPRPQYKAMQTRSSTRHAADGKNTFGGRKAHRHEVR